LIVIRLDIFILVSAEIFTLYDGYSVDYLANEFIPNLADKNYH